MLNRCRIQFTIPDDDIKIIPKVHLWILLGKRFIRARGIVADTKRESAVTVEFVKTFNLEELVIDIKRLNDGEECR